MRLKWWYSPYKIHYRLYISAKLVLVRENISSTGIAAGKSYFGTSCMFFRELIKANDETVLPIIKVRAPNYIDDLNITVDRVLSRTIFKTLLQTNNIILRTTKHICKIYLIVKVSTKPIKKVRKYRSMLTSDMSREFLNSHRISTTFKYSGRGGAIGSFSNSWWQICEGRKPIADSFLKSQMNNKVLL